MPLAHDARSNDFSRGSSSTSGAAAYSNSYNNNNESETGAGAGNSGAIDATQAQAQARPHSTLQPEAEQLAAPAPVAVLAQKQTSSAEERERERQEQEQEQEPHPLNPERLYLLSHPQRGRGVFAPRPLSAGTILEESPVLVLSREQWEQGRMDDTILGEYGFCWSAGGMGIGLGLASLFNHSPRPNVNFIKNTKTSTIKFITCRRVEKGEELCICYSADESKLWFTPAAASSSSGTANQNGITTSTTTDVLGSGSVITQPQSLDPDNEHQEEEISSNGSVGSRAALPDVHLGLAVDDLLEPDLQQAKIRREQRLAAASSAVQARGADLNPRERRKMKALAKRGGTETHLMGSGADDLASEAKAGNEDRRQVDIQSPKPVRFQALPSTQLESIVQDTNVDANAGSSHTPTPRSTSVSTTTSATSSKTYDYPAPALLPAEVTSDLPAPLHSEAHKAQSRSSSTSRHSREKEELTPDLEWKDEDWPEEPKAVVLGRGKGKSKGKGKGAMEEKQKSEEEDRWGESTRIRGTADKEIDGESRETMKIWAVEFTDDQLTKIVLNFSKELSADVPSMKHLKRVSRKVENGIEICRIAIAPVEDPILDPPYLIEAMKAFSPLLSSLVPVIHHAPTTAAKTQAQLRWKLLLWPVSFSSTPIPSTSSIPWSESRKAWVYAGIQRVLSIALAAGARGEIPVGVYCTAPPERFWPSTDNGFIPPTANLRAASYDTRISENHPLRHAAHNCVAAIAKLRTLPPFTDVAPTRNGADYLLTSLSLFISHEPCVMCSMALLHSRVREVFYVFPRKKGGGFELDRQNQGCCGGVDNEGDDEGLSARTNPDGTASTTAKGQGGSGGGVEATGSADAAVAAFSAPTPASSRGFGIHANKHLNHRYQVWRWDGEISQEVRSKLDIDEDIAL